jgi:predicted transcriptional regulator
MRCKELTQQKLYFFKSKNMTKVITAIKKYHIVCHAGSPFLKRLIFEEVVDKPRLILAFLPLLLLFVSIATIVAGIDFMIIPTEFLSGR